MDERKMNLPRVMFAAPASGSGKTLITCGFLKALKNRGVHAASFKCGPDYIDPMFHQTVLGIPARNLDTFFTDTETTRYLFGRAARNAEISVLEGVMGYYDGAGADTTTASSYELANVTETPVILIVNAKGMGLSVVPLIQGFIGYRQDSHIAGVILNQVSSMVYKKLKQKIEQELSVPVFGYVPRCPELVVESRHLGLVLPEEVKDIQEKLQKFSELLIETVEIEKIISCAKKAPELEWGMPKSLELSIKIAKEGGLFYGSQGTSQFRKKEENRCIHRSREKGQGFPQYKLQGNVCALQIGIAKDEAFCFMYQDNLELLKELGAELVYFSPVHDVCLPSQLDGVILYGGYPELYAKRLSQNSSMRKSVKNKIRQGLPFLAECGGFMYLQESMEDMEGNVWEMAGVFAGKAYWTKKLGRFGYLTLTARSHGQILRQEDTVNGHEYHYFDCTQNGSNYCAKKPFGTKEWECMQGQGHYAAGFPHLYYYSNPRFLAGFLQQCRKYAAARRENPFC